MLSWKERSTFFMRKNAIIKMVVSAAAAAYVAVMPVQAEENGEDEIEYTESGYEAGAVSEEAVDGSDGEGKALRSRARERMTMPRAEPAMAPVLVRQMRRPSMWPWGSLWRDGSRRALQGSQSWRS